MQEFISAQLLELLASQGNRKFLAYAGDLEEAKDALLVWVVFRFACPILTLKALGVQP